MILWFWKSILKLGKKVKRRKELEFRRHLRVKKAQIEFSQKWSVSTIKKKFFHYTFNILEILILIIVNVLIILSVQSSLNISLYSNMQWSLIIKILRVGVSS